MNESWEEEGGEIGSLAGAENKGVRKIPIQD